MKHVFVVAISVDHGWLQTVKGTRTPGTERPYSESELKALFVSKVTTFWTNDECGGSVRLSPAAKKNRGGRCGGYKESWCECPTRRRPTMVAWILRKGVRRGVTEMLLDASECGCHPFGWDQAHGKETKCVCNLCENLGSCTIWMKKWLWLCIH